MILGDALPVLHRAPARPGPNLVATAVPDALTPDHVVHVQLGGVVHDPLGDVGAARAAELEVSTARRTAREPKYSRQSRPST